MPVFNSSGPTDDLQQTTETILQKAISVWQLYPTSILLYKREAGTWSATQCLMHLNSYGRYYLPTIEISIEEAEKKNWYANERFETSFIGNWFTELMKPEGEKKTMKKMKSPKEHTPQVNEKSNEVLTEFITQQRALLALLERARTIDLRKAKTPVSLSRFIRLPLGDTFRFLVAHTERHVLQAERAVANAKEEALPV